MPDEELAPQDLLAHVAAVAYGRPPFAWERQPLVEGIYNAVERSRAAIAETIERLNQSLSDPWARTEE